MGEMFNEVDLAHQERIKCAFDPDMLLNPGKVFPHAAPLRRIGAHARASRGGRISGHSAFLKDMSHSSRYAPATAADVQQIVAEAALERRTLEVCGGGLEALDATADRLGSGARHERRLGITDYDPDEFVVTARAGTPLDGARSRARRAPANAGLRTVRSRSAIRCRPGRATLGGVIAANVSGSRRLASGAARDHILGFTAVSGRGEPLKGGGAVVKNVTGFDLPKLMAGSWGTLGGTRFHHLRVLPRPRAEKTLLIGGLSSDAAQEPDELRDGDDCSGFRRRSSARAEPAYGIAPRGLRSLGRRAMRRAAARAAAGRCLRNDRSRREQRVLAQRAYARCTTGAGHVLWRISVPPAHGGQIPSLLTSRRRTMYTTGAARSVWAAMPEAPALAQAARFAASPDRSADTPP